MGIDSKMIEIKLAEMHNEMETLASIRKQEEDKFLTDEESKVSTLAAFKVVAELISLVSSHVVIQNEWGAAESYGNALDELANRGVLSQDLVKKLRSFISMNKLISLFPTTDYKAIWDTIQPTIEDVQNFVYHIRIYLEKLNR